MAKNTKNTERELKIQTTSKFFVKYKRREKKYKKQLLRLKPAGAPGREPWCIWGELGATQACENENAARNRQVRLMSGVAEPPAFVRCLC